MRLHRNARTCPASRRLLVRRVEQEGWSLVAAAEAAGISERSAAKWLARWRGEGDAGLWDRSSAPRRIPHKTPPDRVAAIAALRRLRMTGAEISWILGMPLATVHAVLGRIGLGKLSRLDPIEPANRYLRRWPGELLHIDVKKLARIDGVGHAVTGIRQGQKRRTGTKRLGYDYVHVCVDDATRLAHGECAVFCVPRGWWLVGDAVSEVDAQDAHGSCPVVAAFPAGLGAHDGEPDEANGGVV